MVPGRKFCTRTSACATSLARTSRPNVLLTSTDSERLPRFEEMNSAENSPDLSMVARLQGQYDEARAYLDEVLKMATDVGDHHEVANALLNLGGVFGDETVRFDKI